VDKEEDREDKEEDREDKEEDREEEVKTLGNKYRYTNKGHFAETKRKVFFKNLYHRLRDHFLR
jgi:hypothetical protein